MNSSFSYIVADEKGFKGSKFDELLAAGYYRMQHIMFTCNDTSINENEPPIPVFWLRTSVYKHKLNKSAKNILKKCSKFSVAIKKAYVNDEVEYLYRLYKNHVQFQVSSSCSNYLHQNILPQPFDSMMVEVRDNDELIAVGYFDKGKKTIAGIMNIYHPDYNSFSLGKFLMLQKLQYAASQNMIFYYTGYISTRSTRFDYKTFPDADAVEVLLPIEQQWVQYHMLSKLFLAEYYEKFIA